MTRRVNPRLKNPVMPLLFAAGSAILCVTTISQADDRHLVVGTQNAEQSSGERQTEVRPTPWTRFLEILEEHNIPHDLDNLEKAALRAMLHSVDRHAKILSSEDAEILRLRESGFRRLPRSLMPDADAYEETSPERILPLHIENWPHDIVYIKINGLYESVGGLFREALTNAAASRDAGLIIDLRHAGGRDFDAVDQIAAFFVADNTLLYEIQTLAGETQRKGLTNDGIPRWNAPAIVVTGNQTVQAAELLASILRETHGVMLLGNRTRGDPKLRELYRWSENYYLYLPTAVIKPAQHDDYTLVGVVPHIHVLDDYPTPLKAAVSEQETDGEEEQTTPHPMPDTIIQDPPLARAVDILIGLEAIDNFKDANITAGDENP